MKRVAACLIACICCMSLLSACGEKDKFDLKETDIKADESIHIAKTEKVVQKDCRAVKEYDTTEGDSSTQTKITYAQDGSSMTVESYASSGEVSRTSVEFDECGNITRSHTDDGISSEYEYDCNLVKISLYNKQGEFEKKNISVYDSSLQLTSTYIFNGAGVLEEYSIVEYTDENKVKVTTTTGADGSVKTEKKLYNEAGKVVSALIQADKSTGLYEYGYNESGDIIYYAEQKNSTLVNYSHIYSVSTEKDEHGNITKATYKEQEKDSATREYKYSYTDVKYKHYMDTAKQIIGS